MCFKQYCVSLHPHMRKGVLVIGVTPDANGIGGVTIHVQRLLDYLKSHGVDFSFKNYRDDGLFDILQAVRRSRLVHLHISNPVLQFLWMVGCRVLGTKTVMTLHGNYGRFGKLKNFLVRCSLRLATVPIVINKHSYDACLRLNKNIRQIGAFIPPQREEPMDAKAGEIIQNFREQGKIIVSTNAFNVAYDKDGRDMYGIDFLISFFSERPQYALLVSDPSGNYSKKYPAKRDNECFIDYPHSYFEVLKRVDCFVRNTPTDGDALSVREALYLGKPTLCSDAVDRPEGVKLFRYSDAASFSDSLSAISPLQQGEGRMANGAEEIMNIYKTLLK